MIEELRKNVETEISMLKEIATYERRIELAPDYEKRLLYEAINSLKESIKIINNTLPKIIKDISLTQKLIPSKNKKTSLENIKVKRIDSHVDVVLGAEDKEKFLRELSINEKLIRKIKKREGKEKDDFKEFKAARGYLKFANKFFLRTATKSIEKGNFKELSVSLRKANIDILFKSYVAMIYFSLMLSIIFSLILFVFLIFFQIETVSPFFSFYEGSYLLRIGKMAWIPFVLPILTFFGIYFYPTTERKAIATKIDQELPFAVIHMSAISGSGIEPSEIFKIIGLSKEYPALRQEIRKVLNQINLYGYDLTTALNNASKTAPSESLAELFSGLSTAINSGANLSDFLEERSSTLLLQYRLEREKYTKVVETFLDIYISVVIAAPMIFLLLLVMMAISGIQIGFSTFQLSLIGVVGIAILNMFFIIFLQLKQPVY